MIMFCEVQLLRHIVALGYMEREELTRQILEAFPQSDLRRVYNNGDMERMTLMLKSDPYTGKEIELYCKLKSIWLQPKKLKMNLVRWLYRNGLSTVDANIVADKYIPQVKKAYSTTPVETTYSGRFASFPKTIEREVINLRLGYAPEPDRVTTTNPVEMNTQP